MLHVFVNLHLCYGGILFESACMSNTPLFAFYSMEMEINQESFTTGLLKDLLA